MISYLQGKPVVTARGVTIIVNGVGYGVIMGGSDQSKVSVLETVEVFVHTHVREDSLELFAFLTAAQVSVFELLLSVSGVGPKTAVHIVDRGVDAVLTAIRKADITFFTSVPRVGKKVGQKIIIDLQSKIGSTDTTEFQVLDSNTQQLVTALQELGFSQTIAQDAAQQCDPAADFSLSLKQALKYIGSGK